MMMMMVDEAAVNRRFLKILLPGFSTKLSIPNAFVKANGNHRGREKNTTTTTITLVSPKGKVWHVGLYKKRESVYIGGDGWAQLAAANGLKVGYALVFRYRGNMVFSFRIFDLSACEKNYCNRNCNYSSVPQMGCGDRNYSSGPAHEVKDEDGDEEETNGPLNASTSTVTKGRFKITIVPTHTRHGCTFIPSRYRETSGLTMEDTQLTVRDPMGRKWDIGLTRRKGKGDEYMTRGWLPFAQANKLKVGDRCVFKLVSRGKKEKVFQVKIHRK